MVIQPQQFKTQSLDRIDRGEDICRVLAAALRGADAGEAIRRHVSRQANQLSINNINLCLDDFNEILILGAGKASLPMAEAVCELLDGQITRGIVITKDGYLEQADYTQKNKVDILEASHPIPAQRNIEASSRLVSLARGAGSNDLAIFLLSGGGSSLFTLPAPGLSLQDVQSTTELLLRSGASIGEINTLRKHIDWVKGGGLAKLLAPAMVIALILSDVLGDALDMIASGPTVADPTTYAEAWGVLIQYGMEKAVAPQIRTYLSEGIEGKLPETVKPGNPVLQKVTNIIVGNNQDALSSAADAARSIGFNTRILTSSLQGEASQAGYLLCEEAKALLDNRSSISRPACFIAGGETTVTVTGDGLGGRNQELALGAVKSLGDTDSLILASLATDGGDGPTDAAGAIATSETLGRGLAMGLDPADYLRRNDSYRYFESLGDLIKIGPTLTNVNDLVFIFGL